MTATQKINASFKKRCGQIDRVEANMRRGLKYKRSVPRLNKAEQTVEPVPLTAYEKDEPNRPGYTLKFVGYIPTAPKPYVPKIDNWVARPITNPFNITRGVRSSYVSTGRIIQKLPLPR